MSSKTSSGEFLDMMDRPVKFPEGKKWALITGPTKCPGRRNESPGKKERCGLGLGLWAPRPPQPAAAGQTMGKSRTGGGRENVMHQKTGEVL